ncbi:hypothetical protein [Poseidonibacter ostreae]|uniref:Uncharacterized protein n=1 Tax=Poseidonibacter ostreae TaxID=2654171 RepID=A0A6L4WWX5_9BACT|nr:hypothetical protein [Poseidonibacter ostreae]KAB7891381.1 hypothetical protein GBG19_00665 [Poseidonibacter ostreae]
MNKIGFDEINTLLSSPESTNDYAYYFIAYELLVSKKKCADRLFHDAGIKIEINEGSPDVDFFLVYGEVTEFEFKEIWRDIYINLKRDFSPIVEVGHHLIFRNYLRAYRIMLNLFQDKKRP